MKILTDFLPNSEFLPLVDFYPSTGATLNKLRYISGLFDGEGCVIIEINKLKDPKRKNQMRACLKAIISNTYLPILEECKFLFRGHIKKCKR